MSQAAAILISRGIDNWRDGFDKPEPTKDA
jgi:hypothetical protein